MPPVGLLKPTLALDFDGVLNTYASGFRPDYVPDPPVRGALEALESYAPVFQLVIFSTRAADPEGVSSILDWLGRNGFGAIPLTVTAEKPQAFAYLDDRGLNFPGPGQFPTVEELLSFHPWWEKSESSSFPEIDAATAATAVSSLMARAGAADNAITESLSRAVDLAGGYLDGLDDRLKTQSSLAAKLANVMLEKNLDLAAAAADVKDALRYSAVFAGERYVPASAVVLDLLERGAGLDLERLRNYWLPSEGGSRYAEGTYLGVNCVLRSPNGFVFELQFHTPQSLDVQQVNWDFYRLIRSGRLPPEDRGVVEAQMRQNNEFVPVPAAVGTLGGDVAATVSAAGPMAEPDRTDAERDIPADAHYRAAADLDRSCGTCSYFGAGTNFRCGMFDVLVSPEMVCDEWAEGLPGALPTQWTWDDLDEVSPPLVSAAPGVTSTSTMIAVKPRPEEAAAIADSEDGDPPADLHVTLAYLGELDGDLGPVADALRLVAAEFAPLEGVVGGSGRFDPPGVGILLPDVRGLVELRTAVCEALIAADLDYGRDHGFEAHITVDSDGTPDARGVGEELHFDDLLVVRGDSEVIAIPLTGAMPLTATALVAAGEPFCLPDELRGVTDPIRTAFVQAVMTPALEEAGLSWTLSNPLAAGVIAQAGQHIVGISQTTQNDVMNVIHYSHDQGLSIPDTAKAIRSHMREASNARATMIARTEMAGAVNGGSLAAAKIAVQTMGGGAPGSGGGTKTWHTAPGALYPRHEDYDDLDGQTVALDDEFQVGEDQLQFPGDPNGDPGEVINCRCVLTYSGGSGDVAGENMDAAGERRDLLAAHNRRLVAAHARIDALEPKLVRALEPIFVRAGEVAARRFEALATNHLTAAGDWTPPAPEEILPVNCEEAAAGLAQAGVDARGALKVGVEDANRPELFGLAGRWVDSKNEGESYVAAAIENAAKPNHELAVARDASGNVVGAADYRTVSGSIYIDTIGSTTAGGGTSLMTHVAQVAAERGLGVKLLPTESSAPFYEKIGMTFRDGYYEWTPDEAAKFAGVEIGTAPELAPSDLFTIEGGQRGQLVALRQQIEETLGQLGDLVDLPDRSNIPEDMRLTMQRKTTSRGYLKYRTAGGRNTPIQLNVVPGSSHPAVTTAHEFGHLLDLSYLGETPGIFQMQNISTAGGELASALQELAQAWLDSGSYKALDALPSGDRLARYMKSYKELWARSFAQWAASRAPEDSALFKQQAADIKEEAREVAGRIEAAQTGDEQLMMALGRFYPQAWQPDDFTRISAAIERVLRAAGLLAG